MGWCLLPPFGPSQILLVRFWQQHKVPYWDLLLWDNSCKQTFSCLTKAGSFNQWLLTKRFIRIYYQRYQEGNEWTKKVNQEKDGEEAQVSPFSQGLRSRGWISSGMWGSLWPQAKWVLSSQRKALIQRSTSSSCWGWKHPRNQTCEWMSVNPCWKWILQAEMPWLLSSDKPLNCTLLRFMTLKVINKQKCLSLATKLGVVCQTIDTQSKC